jgi:hypothetical protein
VGSFKEFLVENAPRIKRVKVRFRNGKPQRNVKVGNVPGFRLSQGRLVRMSSTEKIHRKRGAMKSRFKRRAKLGRALIKRIRTLRRRNSIGL